jgi:hypothetical protein
MVALPSGSINSVSLQSALNKHKRVKLPAGEVITLTVPVYIPAGRKLYSDPANPATIRRIPLTRQRMLVFNGQGSTIAHLKMDFNFATGWEPYVICIAFSAEEFANITPQDKSGCKVINVEFVESNGVVIHPIAQTGDSWCISFATDFNGAIQRNIAVIGCRCTAPFHQLTANGQGLGQENITIEYCATWDTYATAIAISTRTDGAVFRDITIRHCFLMDIEAYGIFIGQDTQEVIAIDADIDGVLIDQNYIQHSASRLYITSIVIRSGLDGGSISNFVISNNISDATKSFALQPRSISVQSDTEGSEVQIINNKTIKFAQSVFFLTDVIQSGNTYYGTDTPWIVAT